MPKSVSEILLESASLKQKLAADKEFISLIENLAELMTAAFRDDKKVLFCGNGSKKLQPLIKNAESTLEKSSALGNLMVLFSRVFNRKFTLILTFLFTLLSFKMCSKIALCQDACSTHGFFNSGLAGRG